MCEVAGRVFAKLSVAGILDTGHRALVAGVKTHLILWTQTKMSVTYCSICHVNRIL